MSYLGIPLGLRTLLPFSIYETFRVHDLIPYFEGKVHPLYFVFIYIYIYTRMMVDSKNLHNGASRGGGKESGKYHNLFKFYRFF